MRYRLLLVLATLIWGSSFVIVKDVTDYLDPACLLAFRFFTAGIILAVALLGKRKLYFKREYVLIGLLFGVFMFLGYYTQTQGVRFTTPGKNAFLTGVYCVLVPFFAWFGMKKRPTKFNLIAAFLCVVGVGFVSLGNVDGINIGDLLTLLCAVFYAIHIVLVSKFSQERDIFVLTMWQFLGVGICSVIVAGVTGEELPSFGSFSIGQWGSLSYLAIACTTLALLFQNVGQKHVPPASASLLLSLESPFGVAFSVLLGAEVLTGKIFIGFVLIFVAILISEVLPERMAKRGEASAPEQKG